MASVGLKRASPGGGVRRTAVAARFPPGAAGSARRSDGPPTRPSFRLLPIDMIGSGKAARGEQHHEKQRRHGEGDYDRGEDQSLGQRIGRARGVRSRAPIDARRRIDQQTPHRREEENSGVKRKSTEEG